VWNVPQITRYRFSAFRGRKIPHFRGSQNYRSLALYNRCATNAYQRQASWGPFLPTCSSVLVPTITNIVSLSLTSGQFHPILKESVISPLLKKSTLDKDQLSNYRPVSNLCLICESRPLGPFNRCFLTYCEMVVLVVVTVLWLMCLDNWQSLSLRHFNLTSSQSHLSLILNILACLISCCLCLAMSHVSSI